MQELAKRSVFSKGKFHNTEELPVMLPGSYLKLIRESRKNRGKRKPGGRIPSTKPVFTHSVADSSCSVIWLGHSMSLIRVSGITILTDPVFSKRASPVSFSGPQSFKLENPLHPEDLPKPDIILISHDHFDHLDHKTIRDHFNEVSTFLVPLGLRDHLERWGIRPEQIREFDWWEEAMITDKLSIVATPAQHFSGRRRQDNHTLWCSWVIRGAGVKLYFSGDTGYGDHFRAIGNKFGPFDLALMECGAYGKYWPNIHMKPEETVQASEDIRASAVLPIHWGKFNMAFHPWKEPIQRFITASEIHKVNYTTPLIGEQIIIGSPLPKKTWWDKF